MKFLVLSLLSVLPVCCLRAQTKIFKEVGEDIATEIKAISQDNTLVGYLAFTRLEKADADSFNYRLTIMDENLNDIGKVNFREGVLDLQAVSFEQNVLCLGYIQRGLTTPSHIVLQFVNLDGKVVGSYSREIHLETGFAPTRRGRLAPVPVGFLKFGMQIRNIPDVGFAFFYGDGMQQNLMTFDLNGKMTHGQDAPAMAEHYYLRASATAIYLLTKQDVRVPEGGYHLYVYSSRDLEAGNNFDLRDRYDNWLKVLTFDNDPVSGDAFIAGCIINPRRERQFLTANDYAYGPYLGLYTLDLGNPHKEMSANTSYWSGNNMQGISGEGQFKDRGFYVRYATAFRDYSGNTIFAGTALFGHGFVGAARYMLADGVFVRQDATGNLVLDNTVPCDETKEFGDGGILFGLDKKDYYKVDNPDTKTNYMIIDDEANIYIYNVSSRKVVRTIPHKDGNVKINVYPAKQGYMLVAEYNRKEKFTRFSIEAL